MLKLLKKNGRKRIVAALSAAVLVFSGSTGFIDLNNSAIYAATGEYKSWKQSDPRWSGIYLGGSKETMSQSGCAVTSVACLVVQAGCLDESEFNPGILCNFLNQNGGLDAWGNIYWGVVSKLVPDFIFDRTAYLYGSSAEEKASEIKSYLDQGYYVISDVRYSGHWVAIDKVEDGVVYSIDPASGVSNKMFEQYNFNGSTTLKLFRKRSSGVQVPPSSSFTYKTGSYLTTAKLNLRSEASALSVKLDVIENNYKINVTEISGNWGKVCYNNKTGWICLDYASRTGDIETEKNYTKGTYVINAVMHYRENADVSSKSYGTIPKDTTLIISEISSNWGKTVYNGQVCWVCLDYSQRVSDLPVEPTPEVTEENIQYSIGSYKTTAPLNFRSGAGTDNSVICVIPSGTDVVVSEVSGNWGKIAYNNSTGWISLTYAVSLPPAEGTVTEPVVVTQAPQTQVPSVTTPVTTAVTTPVTPVVSVPVTTESTPVTTETTPVTTEITTVTTTIPVTTVVSTEQSILQTTCVQTNPPVVTESQTNSIISGDINGDGIVNAIDMMCLIDVFLNDNVTSNDFKRFDVNNDMVVSSKDIIALKFILLSEK